MNLDLTGKRALVCGSTQGIGKATAIELALLGASVTLLARNEEKLRLVLEELPKQNDQLHDFLIADFTDPLLLKSIIGNYTANNRVDILINNTGGPTGGQAIDAGTDEFINAFNMHLICNQILVQAIVPGMKKNHFGRIINIISTSVKTPLKGLGVSNTIRGGSCKLGKDTCIRTRPFWNYC
uniref:SDR family NAD(P)-dependent oxidoreductase n=1 Tax=Daejeonella sp. TaxID=2805397 RepID=UPI004048EDF0